MAKSRKPKSKKRDKQHAARAASFKRIAKVLRIRAAAYLRVAKNAKKEKQSLTCDFYHFRALTIRDIAAELDNEAATLRAMR
jgi:DNA-directed RNA polymerase specialized sigma54-like protein